MKKPRGRPFEPGNTFGRGRPKGSRNKPKLQGQDLVEQYAEAILRKGIHLALQGNASALRQMTQRIIPYGRDARVRISLPPIRKMEDIEPAAEKLMRAIRRGEITPQEGETMMRILESRSRMLEKVDIAKRLEKLEQQVEQRERAA